MQCFFNGVFERHAFVGLSRSGVLAQKMGACMRQFHPIELPSHDFLSSLVRLDPQGYEALRSTLINELIDRAPERLKPRLRGMQFRIDYERRLSKSALGMTVKLYRLMWASFLKLNEGLQDLHSSEATPFTAQEPTPAVSLLPQQCARVLEFQPRQKDAEGVPEPLP